MRKIRKTLPKVSREKAVVIAANHNNISREQAAQYTDSELREVLKQLKLTAGF